MSTLWTRKIGGKNAHVYVYVYGYKVRLHVYKICVNVAALDVKALTRHVHSIRDAIKISARNPS